MPTPPLTEKWVPLWPLSIPAAAPTYDISLPASPINGQEAILVDSVTAPTYAWRFRYSTAVADAYKWVFVGGGPLNAEVIATEGTSSAAYVALATPGPIIVLPRAGIYEVRLAFNQTSNDTSSAMSYDIGATAAVDADGAFGTPRGASGYATHSGFRRKTFPTAVTLTAKYRSPSSGASTYHNREMAVIPIRVA